jgi:hypothetical protein
MYPFIFSAAATLIIALVDWFRKSRRQIMDYIAIFFLIAGFNFLIKAQEAHASMPLWMYTPRE